MLGATLLGEDDLDVTEIDLLSLKLGGAAPVSAIVGDVNGEASGFARLSSAPSTIPLLHQTRWLVSAGWGAPTGDIDQMLAEIGAGHP